MPNKHPRPAALQRRSTSGSNTKLNLTNLNLQKLDTNSNLQLQVALNNATKDLPRGKGKKSSGRPNVRCDLAFNSSTLILKLDHAFCHSNPQVGRKVINKSDHPLNCICNSSQTYNARQLVPLTRLHPNAPTLPPPPDPPRSLALPSLVLPSPPRRLKAKATLTNGSQARVFR